MRILGPTGSIGMGKSTCAAVCDADNQSCASQRALAV
jgi:dephospho-CoA kinase